jgi:hypothetical protein
MVEHVFPDCRGLSQCWSEVFRNVVWNQWKLLDAQYEAGIELLGSMRKSAAESDPVEKLQQAAAECLEKGQPPPRVVYEAQNRNRIDWTKMPEWARPADPELFEGAGHEG